MCQYDARCKVINHKTPQACPYYGRNSRPYGSRSSGGYGTYGSGQGYGAHGAGQGGGTGGGAAAPRPLRASVATIGVGAGESLIWWIIAASVAERHPWFAIVAAVAIAFPLIAAAVLVGTCGQWLDSTGARCRRLTVRRGAIFQRCGVPGHDRAITAPDVAAVLLILLAIANLIALFMNMSR